jgi:hypothetical protein
VSGGVRQLRLSSEGMEVIHWFMNDLMNDFGFGVWIHSSITKLSIDIYHYFTTPP